MSRIFISHASRDLRLARELGLLLQHGLQLPPTDVFISTAPASGIPPGEYWRNVLRQELEGAEHVIALLTPAWLDSQWCMTEGAVAWLRGKLLPLHYLPAGKVPPTVFDDVQHLELGDPSALDRLADRITASLAPAAPISRAHWSQQRDAFTSYLSTRSPDTDDRPEALLPRPGNGLRGVLLDTSHGQREWRQNNELYSREGWAATLGQPLGNARLDLGFIENAAAFSSPNLAAWSGLMLAMPASSGGPKPPFSPNTIDRIVSWVRAGGRLALLGFELGDRHHATNLNALAERFGLRFNSDIVAPKDWSGSDKPYDRPVRFPIPEKHTIKQGSLLQDLREVEMRNVCTLSVEPGGRTLLPTGGLTVGWPKRKAVRYTEGGTMNVVGSGFRFSIDPRAAAIAVAPAALTGTGRVVGIGTWQLSAELRRNLLRWLGG